MREYVEKRGVVVDLFDTWKAKIENYDVLHVFGSVKDCLGLVQVANARGVRVAISPLLWSDWRRALFNDGSIREKADFIARHAAKVLWPTFPSTRRKLLLSADVLFPNSEIEKRHIARLFGVPEARMRVVPNGVDTEFLNADPSLFRARHGDGSFVLGVGRIEPRKNQLNLIKAVKRIRGKRLFLIGSPVSGYEEYFEECRRQGEGFVTFLPTMGHGDPLLRSAYAACGLFVLQGWFETPGLVALEAILAGARVIVTSGGSTREYFGDDVDYLDPSSPKDIADQITRNCGKSPDDAMKRRVLESYTWEKVAAQTVACYEELAGRSSRVA